MLRARRHFDHRVALQNDLAANRALAKQFHAIATLDQFHHADGGFDGVADSHGRYEAQGLRNVDRTRPRQARADDGRDQTGGVEAMGDAAFEWRLRGEVFRQMDRVAVPGQLRKSDNVRRLDGFGVPFGHSDVQIVKIQGLQGQERHGISPTTRYAGRLESVSQHWPFAPGFLTQAESSAGRCCQGISRPTRARPPRRPCPPFPVIASDPRIKSGGKQSPASTGAMPAGDCRVALFALLAMTPLARRRRYFLSWRSTIHTVMSQAFLMPASSRSTSAAASIFGLEGTAMSQAAPLAASRR